MDPFSTSFLVWALSYGILALSEGTLDVEPKLTPKMHLFMTHFQRVKSCESVINSVQIAFLRIPKKSIDFGATDFGPLQAPEVLTILQKDRRLGTDK